MTRLDKNKKYLENVDWASEKAKEEVKEGLELLNNIDETIITFFGSHLLPDESEHYEKAKDTAFNLGKEGYAVMSGGGPGIMEAANAGAYEAGAPSIGVKAELIKQEETDEEFLTHSISFHYMFVRRFVLSLKSQALIFYPGGYGTLNELFEYAVLMQTDMVDQVPIVCVGREFWQGLFSWIRENMTEYNLLTNHIDDLNILHVVDSYEEILDKCEES